MKKLIFVCLSIISLTVLLSCEVGLGQEVDLIAPKLNVESPSNNAFVSRNFNIEGTATDNIAVSSVYFEYSYRLNGETITGSKSCNVTGDRFSCPFTFDKDAEVSFQITAKDKNNNSSEFSSDTKTFIIDSNDPKVGKISIGRGNYVARLLTKDELEEKAKNRFLPENKDYFQNQKFTLSATLKDSYGVGGAKINLYDSKGRPITSLSMNEDIENKFSPQFEFTDEMLILADPDLKKGLHYIEAEIEAKDVAGNIVREKKGYLAWESEYDIPHVQYSTMEGDIDTNGKITVAVGGNIPITAFDDDGIKSVKYKYIKADSFDDLENISSWESKTVTEGLRDFSFDISIPNDAEDGLYKLAVMIEDINTPSTVYKKAVDLKITNGDAATIIIDEPTENSVPLLDDNGKFTLSGYSIDNQDVKKIAVAWLPGENNDIAKAEAFFNTYSFDGDKTTTTGTTSEKIEIKKPIIEISENYDSNKKKNKFSITYDFFEDFKINDKVSNNTKVFIFACKDATDNITTKTFRLNKFSTKPSFKVEYSYDNGSTWTTETNPLIVCKLKKTNFRITPTVENNMPITECSISLKGNAIGFTQTKNWTDNKIIEFILSNGADGAPSSGQQYNFTLDAKDKIDGETKSSLTIAFEEVGELESIDVNYVGGENAVPLTASDTLRFQANFTNRVSIEKIEGKTPYIQLSGTSFKYKDGNDVEAKDRRAYYKSGSDSNTFYFEYKIPDNIELEAKNLTINSNEPINLNGLTPNEIQGVFTKTNVGSTFNNKKIALDSIAPYVVTYSPNINGIKDSSVNAGVRSVDISLTFNEPVDIESGTIVLQRTKNWYIPPVISEDVFLKMFNSTTAINNKSLRSTLCGSQTNVRTKNSTDRLGNPTILPDGPYLQYTQGLNLSNTGAVPDISTKYVLKYEYNIADTTGVVKNLRDTLEKFNYHKAEFDIQSMTKSPDGTTLTLKVTDSDFIDCLKNGVEYSLTITSDSIYDKAYNYVKESETNAGYFIGADEYKFVIGPVATPVIRVDRKATNAVNDAPTGRTDIKIDCETPGVTITWGQKRTEKTGNNKAGVHFNSNIWHTNIDDLTSSSVTAISCDETINNVNGTTEIKNSVGDGSMNKASKTYIKAIATKTSMTDSTAGYEGAFKTMLYYNKLNKNNDTNSFFVFGAQNPEGASYTSGWPLTQNVYGDRASYQIGHRNGDNRYWESWQILTEFMMQTNAGSGTFQSPAEPGCSYGQYIYGENVSYY